jgi:hypothetical protein
VFHPRNNVWMNLKNLTAAGPSARFGHALTSVGADLFLFGGHTCSASSGADCLSNQLWKFSNSEWTLLDGSDSSKVPPARYRHGQAAYNQQIFVSNGKGLGGVVLNDLFCFDSVAGKWQELPREPLSAGRHGHLLVSLGDNKLYTLAGVPQNGQSAPELASFDLLKGSWVPVGPAGIELGVGRLVSDTTHWQGISGVEIGGRLVVFASWSEQDVKDEFFFGDEPGSGRGALSDSLFLPEDPHWAAVECDRGGPDKICFGWHLSQVMLSPFARCCTMSLILVGISCSLMVCRSSRWAPAHNGSSLCGHRCAK